MPEITCFPLPVPPEFVLPVTNALPSAAMHYTVVVVQAAGPQLYAGPAGQVLAQVPPTAIGLGVCFAASLLPTGTRHYWPCLLADAPPLALPPVLAAELHCLLASLDQQLAEGVAFDLSRAYLHALLLRCASLWPVRAAGAAPDHLTAQFHDLLEQRFRSSRAVGEYARALYVTPDYLSERVRRHTGQPASALIRQRVMQEARHLLAVPGAQLKQVAYALGFPDVAHFGKLFKRHHGCSFTVYRGGRAAGTARPGFRTGT